ncbi:hypothetical protein CY35_04G034300 [Sphagnum magellanicum]|nr:hypothetical protein CY35_04G034300 [Sphagnum magellanicum]
MQREEEEEDAKNGHNRGEQEKKQHDEEEQAEEEEEETEYVVLDLDEVFNGAAVPANCPYTLTGLDTMAPVLTLGNGLKLKTLQHMSTMMKETFQHLLTLIQESKR